MSWMATEIYSILRNALVDLFWEPSVLCFLVLCTFLGSEFVRLWLVRIMSAVACCVFFSSLSVSLSLSVLVDVSWTTVLCSWCNELNLLLFLVRKDDACFLQEELVRFLHCVVWGMCRGRPRPIRDVHCSTVPQGYIYKLLRAGKGQVNTPPSFPSLISGKPRCI